MSQDTLFLGGLLLIMLGFIVLILSFFLGAMQGEKKVQGGGFILIGPFPIAFGSLNTPQAVKILQAIGVILTILFVLYLFFVNK